jgi:single-strand DNA-binding protein
MLNKCQLIGRLGKDPESRFFPSGDQQTTASLATIRRWKDKSTGERKEKTSWHNLVFNRGLAKTAAEYLKKGSNIYVEGEIDYQEWDKDGVKHYSTKIIVLDMHMLDSKSGGGDPGAYTGGATTQKQQKQNAPGNSAPKDVYDELDDIPF